MFLKLQGTGVLRACPSIDCKPLGQYSNMETFAIFKSDDEGNYYSVEVPDIKDKSKMVIYFINKSAFEKKDTEITLTPKPMGTLITPSSTGKESGPPTKLYAKSYVNVFDCKSEA